MCGNSIVINKGFNAIVLRFTVSAFCTQTKIFVVHVEIHVSKQLIAVRLRVKKKVQNLNAMWYKEFAKNFATQGDFGHESP